MIKNYLQVILATVITVTSIINAAQTKDDDIENTLKHSYNFQHYLKNENIDVNSENGVVTLKGTVKEEYHKALAQETASNISGVIGVQNDIRIKGEPMDKTSDAWLKAKIKAALLFHRNVSGLTDVTVHSGAVTLRGKASSEAERSLTGEYVKDVEGVLGVKNEMTIAKSNSKKETLSEKIDDASITAQVKLSLLAHRSTSGLATKVETQNGIVHLSGNAKNMAEKDLVTKLVDDINGVKDVKNNIAVSN